MIVILYNSFSPIRSCCGTFGLSLSKRSDLYFDSKFSLRSIYPYTCTHICTRSKVELCAKDKMANYVVYCMGLNILSIGTWMLAGTKAFYFLRIFTSATGALSKLGVNASTYSANLTEMWVEAGLGTVKGHDIRHSAANDLLKAGATYGQLEDDGNWAQNMKAKNKVGKSSTMRTTYVPNHVPEVTILQKNEHDPSAPFFVEREHIGPPNGGWLEFITQHISAELGKAMALLNDPVHLSSVHTVLCVCVCVYVCY
jgi:hypothetical protein